MPTTFMVKSMVLVCFTAVHLAMGPTRRPTVRRDTAILYTRQRLNASLLDMLPGARVVNMSTRNGSQPLDLTSWIRNMNGDIELSSAHQPTGSNSANQLVCDPGAFSNWLYHNPIAIVLLSCIGLVLLTFGVNYAEAVLRRRKAARRGDASQPAVRHPSNASQTNLLSISSASDSRPHLA